MIWCDMIWYIYMCVCVYVLPHPAPQTQTGLQVDLHKSLSVSVFVCERDRNKERKKKEWKKDRRQRERERKVHLKCMLNVTCSASPVFKHITKQTAKQKGSHEQSKHQDVHWSAVSQRLKASINNHTPRSDCLLAGIRPAGVTQFNNSETTSKSFRPRASTAVQTVCNDLFKGTAFDAALLNFASKLNLGVPRNNKNSI